MASEFLEILSPNALEELKQVKTLVKSLADDIKSINNFKTSSTPSGADKNIKGLSDAYEKQAQSIEKVRVGLEKTSAIQKQVEQTAKNQNKATQNLTKEELNYRQAVERGIKAKERANKAQAEMSRAYNQLLSKQKDAKKVLQDLIVTRGKESSATIAAQKNYDRLTAKVNEVNKATSNFKNTGLGGIVQGLKGIAGVLGISLAVGQLKDLAKEIFEVTKKLQSLDFAMKAILPDAKDFGRTQEFLTKITNDFGADIITTTERYIKFVAAGKQSNVELKETEKIFKSVTKAAGVLGLKTDELNGIYLALEQMLSKGKVTTEELRRQLGERLPGAFGIMADAIGVSVSELDSMLKKGEVLSSDALPKFAVALEKAYGIQSVKKINTLQAAQTRLSNVWIEFVRSLNNNLGLDQIFTKALNSANALLRTIGGLKESTDNYTDAIKSEQLELNTLATKILQTNEKEGDRKLLMDELIDKYPFLLQYLKDEKISNDDLKNALTEVNKMYVKRLVLQQLAQDLDLAGKTDKEAAALKRLTSAQLKYNEGLIRANINLYKGDVNNIKSTDEETSKRIKEAMYSEMIALTQLQDKRTKVENNRLNYIKRTFDEIYAQEKYIATQKAVLGVRESDTESVNAQIKAMEEQLGLTTQQAEDYFQLEEVIINVTKAEEKSNKAKKDSIDYTSGSQKAIDAQISKLKNLRDSVDQGTVKWETYNFTLKLLETTSKALNGDLNDTKETVGELTKELEKSTKKFKEFLEGVKDMQNEAKDSLKDFRDEFATEFFSDAGFEFTGNFLMNFDKITTMLEEGGNQWEDYFNLITEMGQEAFNFIAQASQQNFDAEYERLEKQKDIALQFAGESDAAKQRIEEQYEARRKVIQRREAKSKKELAIVNTVINTAQAIVATLAATPPPAGLPLAAIMAGIGAAQVAIIASQKIPEFWKGTDNADSGLAWTQERGAEIITDKKGVVKDFGDSKGARLTMMEKGDKVYTSDQTRKMMFNNELNGILSNNGIEKSINSINVVNNGLTKVDLDQVMSKHFSNIQVNELNINKGELKLFVKKQNSITSSNNNRVTFKGFSV